MEQCNLAVHLLKVFI